MQTVGAEWTLGALWASYFHGVLHALILLQAVLVASCSTFLLFSLIYSVGSFFSIYLFTIMASPCGSAQSRGMAAIARYVYMHDTAICPPSSPLLPRCSGRPRSGARASPTFSPANTTSHLPNGSRAPARGGVSPHYLITPMALVLKIHPKIVSSRV